MSDEISAIWVTVTELARRKGVCKSATSQRVRRLEADGLVETKPGRGRAKLINLASYDRAVGEIGDPGKEAGAATRADGGEGGARDPSYRDAQTAKAGYEAELRKLDLAERRRLVLPLGGPDGIEVAIEKFGHATVRALEVLPQRAAEVTAAVLKEGEHGARRVLRQAVVDFRTAIGEALRSILETGKAREATGPLELDLAVDDAS